MHWSQQYVGTPYESLDCWALVAKVQLEQFDAELPSYEGRRLRAIVEAKSGGDRAWREIGHGIEAPGDCILIRSPLHVGIVVDRGSMLHTNPGINAALERYDSPLWLPRIEGFWRFMRFERAD